ncbi:TorD/DmsD family molecular chaperone [Marimonas arenosa]|uniref:Molecular chaperone TorD family protein n=1 Tax=Marimonas arenosa TaxID=1795305 RepID=A0AAE4B348_9RHOB|nr:molecular chaperone TorD family protein [Marimonas arenosa]MDQ2088927.1 molecular chaperone TorD family protein [Marimonas arenosa]
MVNEAPQISTVEAARLRHLAEGLDVLIRFHDRELDRDLLAALRRHDVAAGLRDVAGTDASRQAVQALSGALDDIGAAPDESTLDDLAAEFADLYLTHGYRVSPSGSVWLTEDKLERQMPMFEVRDWYEHYGISVPDWRVRADDHLVHELQFVSFLCSMGQGVAAMDAARFLDLHVLAWLPEFCRRASDRVRQPLYAAVMQLTLAYLDDLRSELEAITGLPRDVREIADLDTSRKFTPEPEPYVPGVAESW